MCGCTRIDMVVMPFPPSYVVILLEGSVTFMAMAFMVLLNEDHIINFSKTSIRGKLG